MEDHVFDPDFSSKITLLFANKFKIVQYDSALRGLKLVFKDTQFSDMAIQAKEEDIDYDLIAEMTFYKKEIARLQGEVNAMRYKMMTNEKTTQAANKDKVEA